MSHEASNETSPPIMREGSDWQGVPWLVASGHASVLGISMACAQCRDTFGLLFVTRKMEVATAELFPDIAHLMDGPELPATLPLGGEIASSLSEEDKEKERREAKWENGIPISTEAQKQRAQEGVRLLQAVNALVEGPDELQLMLAPGFDRVGNHYEKRFGPWREHSRFQQRLDGLKQLIDLQTEEVRHYREALKRPETLPYPELVQKSLESQTKQLLDTWDAYRKVEANGEDVPTQPYFLDAEEGDLGTGITVVCSSCNRSNLLQATLQQVSDRLERFASR